MTYTELGKAESDDPRAVATRKRDALLQTFGNLTLLSQPLNSSVSNSNWTVKRPEILSHSLLPLNLQLATVDTWDENSITQRGEDLLQRALKLWQRS
jgi:hypothetical protein